MSSPCKLAAKASIWAWLGPELSINSKVGIVCKSDISLFTFPCLFGTSLTHLTVLYLEYIKAAVPEVGKKREF
jgi:hypothetical protein